MKITTFNFDNADFSFSDVKNCRRDRGFYKAYNLVGLDDDNNLHEVAEIRYYAAASGNTYYCVFWIHDNKNNKYGYTGGKASGHGYDKANAALESALNAMGITADGWIYEEKFLSALANHLGYKKHIVTCAHE